MTIPKEARELDHPCKQTCSGWQQGFDKGKQSLIPLLEEAIKALEKYKNIVWQERPEGPVWAARDALAKLKEGIK